MKELINIQSKLKAPKNQVNRFGGYNYRSAEDILEAVKPLLAKEGCTLTLTDAIEEIGGRIYVEATATLKNANGETESTTAYAREPETKKGSDESQITGAASSYARKYALNGLFCIDDNRDADATNTHDAQPAAQPQPEKSKAVTIATVRTWLSKARSESDLVKAWKAVPDTLKAESQPLFSARKAELKGGAQ